MGSASTARGHTICSTGVALPVVALLAVAAAAAGEAGVVRLDLRKHPADGKPYKDKAADGGVCLLADISKPAGTLAAPLSGTLPPGAYALRADLKASLTNDLNTAHVEVDIAVLARGRSVPLESRKLTILDFELPKTYRTFELPFSLAQEAALECRIAWKRTGKGVLMRVKATDTPGTPDVPLAGEVKEEGTDEAEAELEEEPDIGVVKHLYLAVANMVVVSRGSIGISQLDVNKIRYRRGEPFETSVALTNYGDTPAPVTVKTELICDLEPPRTIGRHQLDIPARETARLTVNSKLEGEEWGCELRVTALEGEKVIATRSEYFTVADNMWDVALWGRGWHESFGWTRERAAELAKENKRTYANWTESGFWAPDEFGNFTPETDEFAGGQNCYHGSVEGTRVCIEEGHKIGMSFALYSNFWGGDGLDGFELIRRHPDWGYPGDCDVEWLDRWIENIPKTGFDRMRVWPITIMDMRNDEPYKHHARETIEAHRTIGFDATRYDSWGSSEGTKRLLPLVKKWVNDVVPEYQWGYNCAVPDEAANWSEAFDEMCRNGGLIMEEAIRNFHESHETWEYFAKRILDYKDIVRKRGGNFVIVWLDRGFDNDFLYQWIFTLAGQTHGYGNARTVSTGNYAQFATRFAGLLWDRRITNVPNPARWIDVGSAKEFLWMWDRYVHQRDLGGGRRQLIVHLINAPVAKRIKLDDDNAVPPPRFDLKIGVKLPEGATVRTVHLATAEPTLALQELAYEKQTGAISFTVPKLRFWDMVVVELEGAKGFD